MDEASNTPQPIFQRLSFIVVIRGTLLTASHLGLVILYLARRDRLWWTPMNQSHAALYYMTAITTLNIRGTRTSRVQLEDPEAAKGYRLEGAIDQFLLVTVPRTPAEADSFLNYIQDIQRPSPVLDPHPVELKRSEKAARVRSDISIRESDGTKKIGEERRPPQDELGVFSPPENNASSLRPLLAPSLLSKGANMSSSRSAVSKEKERDIDSLGGCTYAENIHPQLIRQLPKVPAEQ
ncbi:hypothetical protein PM082_004085 [Marasmius tenuissimus]|nr:hypothetical protein PM082_004085 [Marasmius tenuissimus]